MDNCMQCGNYLGQNDRGGFCGPCTLQWERQQQQMQQMQQLQQLQHLQQQQRSLMPAPGLYAGSPMAQFAPLPMNANPWQLGQSAQLSAVGETAEDRYQREMSRSRLEHEQQMERNQQRLQFEQSLKKPTKESAGPASPAPAQHSNRPSTSGKRASCGFCISKGRQPFQSAHHESQCNLKRKEANKRKELNRAKKVDPPRKAEVKESTAEQAGQPAPEMEPATELVSESQDRSNLAQFGGHCTDAFPDDSADDHCERVKRLLADDYILALEGKPNLCGDNVLGGGGSRAVKHLDEYMVAIRSNSNG